MSILGKYSFKNFKSFGTHTTINFKPITILTGKNNVGKSNIIKSLLLLRESFSKHQLAFLASNKSLNIGNYKSYVFDNDVAKDIYFELPKLSILGLNLELDVKVQFGNDDEGLFDMPILKKIGFYEKDKLILELNCVQPASPENIDSEIAFHICTLEFNYLKDKIIAAAKQSSIRAKQPITPSNFSGFLSPTEVHSMNKIHGDFSNIGDHLYFRVPDLDLSKETLTNYYFQEFIQTETKGFYNNNYIKKINDDLIAVIQVLEQKFTLNKMSFSINNNGETQGYYNAQESIIKSVPEVFNSFYNSLLYLIEKDLEFDSSQIADNRIERTILYKLFILEFPKLFDTYFKNVSAKFNENLIYLPANRALSDINVSNNFTSNSAKYKRQIENQNEFLNKWLNIFDIGDNIKIEINDYDGNIYFKTETNGVQKNLKDLGYGLNQLTPILIQVSLIGITKWNEGLLNCTPSIFIIEEPETNLHPSFQSKLAEFFVEASIKYNIQFILETHSEYLIRKMQYLVAKNEIHNENVICYYCDKPNLETELTEITFLKDGSLSRDFGKGFCDEADNLAIDLFNLTNKQN